MSQSPTVPQFIGSTIRETNARVFMTDGDASRDVIIGMSTNSPISGLPVGAGYIQTTANKLFMIFQGTNLVVNFDYNGGISYLNCSWAPDVSAFYSLGVANRIWRDLYLDRDFYWTNIPTANPGAGKIWSDGGTLKVGT